MPDPTTIVDVLLVEDNPTDAELCIRALKKHNMANRLRWVKDGAEALALLLPEDGATGLVGDNRPKVVLLDLRLPKVDGLEVLGRLRAEERTRTIPVVVLTSSKEERDIIDSYHFGANSFIAKPVKFDEFVDTVGRLGLYWLVVNRPPPNGTNNKKLPLAAEASEAHAPPPA
jgi:two-component system response regulator